MHFSIYLHTHPSTYPSPHPYISLFIYSSVMHPSSYILYAVTYSHSSEHLRWKKKKGYIKLMSDKKGETLFLSVREFKKFQIISRDSDHFSPVHLYTFKAFILRSMSLRMKITTLQPNQITPGIARASVFWNMWTQIWCKSSKRTMSSVQAHSVVFNWRTWPPGMPH